MEPFETEPPHPCRRPPLVACEKVERSPYANECHLRESRCSTCHPELLFRSPERDPHQLRTSSSDPLEKGIRDRRLIGKRKRVRAHDLDSGIRGRDRVAEAFERRLRRSDHNMSKPNSTPAIEDAGEEVWTPHSARAPVAHAAEEPGHRLAVGEPDDGRRDDATHTPVAESLRQDVHVAQAYIAAPTSRRVCDQAVRGRVGVTDEAGSRKLHKTPVSRSFLFRGGRLVHRTKRNRAGTRRTKAKIACRCVARSLPYRNPRAREAR